MAGATRTITINAPVEKCFSIISDYERYPEFLPEVKKIRTANRRANEVDVHYEAEVVKVIKSGELSRKVALKGIGATAGAKAAIEAAGGSVG